MMSDTQKHRAFPFSAWECEIIAAALIAYAERHPTEMRDRIRALARRLELAKPGVITGARVNAVYAKRVQQ